MTVNFPNLRHLRAFKEVAQHNSINMAAAQIHLSQPAVTQAISGLERDLDIDLFDRRPDGMYVTEPGETFLRRVQRVFTLFENGARRGKQGNAQFYKMASASQLRAFIAIWETGSFSLAARQIGISQPSVHRAGRDLEKLAGQDFFVSSHYGIELTAAAEQFAQAVKLAAAELQQGYDEIALSKGRDSTKIAIGSMPLSRTAIVPEAMNALLAENDGVQLRSVDGPYDELLRGLRYGDLDCLIGALRDPEPSDDVEQHLLFDDPLRVVVGPRHPLVGATDLMLSDLKAFPWIAPPKNTPSGNYLYNAVGIEDLSTTPVRIVASSLILVRGLLARDHYVTIMSERQINVELARGDLVVLDVKLPKSDRPIGLTIRKEWSPTLTQARFLELLRLAATDKISGV